MTTKTRIKNRVTLVWLRYREVGIHHAIIGQVVSKMTGRVLAETDPVPYGMEGAALDRARALAEGRKYVVTHPDES